MAGLCAYSTVSLTTCLTERLGLFLLKLFILRVLIQHVGLMAVSRIAYLNLQPRVQHPESSGYCGRDSPLWQFVAASV
uniref:Uncharacterized protein n=1 Tax=Anguilla anguilla TaxID=7936 RepID=A0A0E9WFJ3_ANGAN